MLWRDASAKPQISWDWESLHVATLCLLKFAFFFVTTLYFVPWLHNNHLVRVRRASRFGPFFFSCHDDRWRWPDLRWKIADFSRHKNRHPQVRLKIPSGVTHTVAALSAVITPPPSPSTSRGDMRLTSLKCERDVPRSPPMSTLDVSVVCRKVNH